MQNGSGRAWDERSLPLQRVDLQPQNCLPPRATVDDRIGGPQNRNALYCPYSWVRSRRVWDANCATTLSLTLSLIHHRNGCLSTFSKGTVFILWTAKQCKKHAKKSYIKQLLLTVYHRVLFTVHYKHVAVVGKSFAVFPSGFVDFWPLGVCRASSRFFGQSGISSERILSPTPLSCT